jgi:peptide/nickel transport system substrate-binding protein
MRAWGTARRLVGLATVGALLAACAATPTTGPSSNAKRIRGGTATVALSPGDQFNWILPLLSYEYATGANIEYSEYLMWRPLYWFGGPGTVGLDEKYSLADPATVTYSGNTTVATIQLKAYRWSDGTPVTSRDVQFWFNLLKVAKQNWWGYVVGQFPDNVLSFKILSPSRLSLTFNGHFAAEWLYNELGQLIPIPQHAWDKRSATGPTGNYDLTTKGAKAVYAFLAAQNRDLSTYATNPLWKVVDGPWTLHSYVSSTGDAAYVRNPKYSGPASGSIRTLDVLSFTSDDAEFDSLLAAKGVTYGYVPFNDAAADSRVTADGYTIAPWPTWGITYISLNFASPPVGAIFDQLYIRQAMQHLIDQPGYIRAFLHGYGNATYGPVPLVPKSQFLSGAQQVNPYAYSVSEAVGLLRSHGWNVVPSGTDTCIRPGSGPTDCGPGIRAGEKLAFAFEYSTGLQAVTEEVTQLETTFSQAGISLSLKGAPFDTVVADDVPCPKAGCWEMNYYGQGWYFDPGYNVPDGGAIFDSTGTDNGGLYDDPTANSLIDKLHTGGDPALYAYEDYLAKNLPVLWMPQLDEQISAVSSTLKGALPQDPLGNIYPENWYFVH